MLKTPKCNNVSTSVLDTIKEHSVEELTLMYTVFKTKKGLNVIETFSDYVDISAEIRFQGFAP